MCTLSLFFRAFLRYLTSNNQIISSDTPSSELIISSERRILKGTTSGYTAADSVNKETRVRAIVFVDDICFMPSRRLYCISHLRLSTLLHRTADGLARVEVVSTDRRLPWLRPKEEVSRDHARCGSSKALEKMREPPSEQNKCTRTWPKTNDDGSLSFEIVVVDESKEKAVISHVYLFAFSI